ncbi:MAG: 16S rRNA (cytidine(1402)-2'-O)-methyltransferase [Candidatus Magasanikbacteria bacterium]|jgi:16S rRNA (cytidine1402-2'-O)-methyltransferase|nr:16S rRNA (cytidine(1402)-2'-O)-methyltransferase [Candidatus Magasanikbacteria bacterium]MBT4315305.1 16S rRNA (cytidine(1402)-2'-O)-methyltransferase [Candidatus Magasanikbacteria bacterium]MBT4547177.1 16S rRNA (cytidine(1402)-2'-O)-methyltransferase [Candidatus Magasanikbacteria bacterium]MBT6819683.1 16S rRNA (cytidine(1402)-2'-O)-methyltransferase [Candidatus Magasanikbacteria bacterium]
MNGKLYIVATPIGNLGDMTLRALETLKSVDFVLCEDTRVTKKLLNRHEIDTDTISYHQHSKDKKINEIIKLLEEGRNLALVTDAGTPGISDPGNQLVQQVTEHGVEVIPIPGASAVTTALSISGFPTDKFVFMGFPPHKKGRKKYFEELKDQKFTVAFYESCHRIKKSLKELSEILDENRQVCVCRELTKKFETIYRGNISQVSSMEIKEKGEFVIVIAK